MTLGGLAVAIGELVDDAIVDVENIHRRLKEWRLKIADRTSNDAESSGSDLRSAIKVVFDASVEVRSSVVYGTAIVVFVFLPLFALEGVEGKLFVPLATAYVVSLLASLLVSLTVTPALASLLLVGRQAWKLAIPFLAFGISALIALWVLPRAADIFGLSLALPGNSLWWALALTPIVWLAMVSFELLHGRDQAEGGVLLPVLHRVAGLAIGFSTRMSSFVLAVAGAIVIVAALALYTIDRDFLPPFNEGAIQVNAILAPGTSLDTSNQIGEVVAQQLMAIDEVETLVRRTGRAETDEHAEGVHASEIVLGIAEHADREQTIEKVRNVIAEIPGVVSSTEQPIAHLISHMLSGVKAQIGVKLYGDDLDTLRAKAKEMEAAVHDIPGLTDVLVEQQTNVPQLRIELDRDALMQYRLRPNDVMELVETAMNGKVVDQILDGQRTFDLLVRLDESFRADESKLRRLTIALPDGGAVPLEAVAEIYESRGPNTINREQVRRRIVLQANVVGRGVVEVANDVKEQIREVELPEGYFVQFGGQFESQASATRRLAIYSSAALVGIFLVLYTLFGNANFALQVLIALPTAFVGAVAALYLTGQTLSVAATVGFISLCGIASRNGILLLNHYLHLVQHEGEGWTRAMVSRAGKERLAPVLMTALTSGIGLLPLALAAGESGKEVLYPVATVIVGGLITSTIAEFFVRPALFWAVGRGAGEAIVADRKERSLSVN